MSSDTQNRTRMLIPNVKDFVKLVRLAHVRIGINKKQIMKIIDESMSCVS